MQMNTGFSFKKWRAERKQRKELENWERSGRPAPPPHKIKQEAIRDHARRYGLRTLVETGTFRGDMVAAMLNDFDTIYSIELSDAFYEKAKMRFDGISKVNLVHGDSGKELARIVTDLKEPALFWLDGHYSAGETARGDKDTPIYEELLHIFRAKNLAHVILVDDARCFGSDPAYPTIEELKQFVRSHRPTVDIVVENDSVRITPTNG